ncbi:hypothetical protein ENUP19_0159G0030 [Entamoeba nuttalli]|uniref:Uncharacterized protein n=1 Tax=Entamoeba nuttalli TaxID=412467 RepID=A0ABQ0DLG9_9EUKA
MTEPMDIIKNIEEDDTFEVIQDKTKITEAAKNPIQWSTHWEDNQRDEYVKKVQNALNQK